MPNEQPGFFTRLKYLIVGDTKRTAKSASVINEMIAAINAFLAMQGVSGIEIKKAAAGFTVQLDEATRRKLGMLPTILPGGEVEPAKGPLRFRGLWDATVTDYLANDIVIWDSDAAIAAGYRAGTFVATAAVPVNTEPVEKFGGTQTYWETFSRGAWDRLKMADSAGAFGSIDLQLTESGTTGTAGKDLAIREQNICVAGVTYKIRGLFSEPFL